MTTTPGTRLPQGMRDPAFLRRLVALDQLRRDAKIGGPEYTELMRTPLVSERVFNEAEVFTHCPRGHMAEHEVGSPPVNHDGREHVARRCAMPSCDASWLEPLHPAL